MPMTGRREETPLDLWRVVAGFGILSEPHWAAKHPTWSRPRVEGSGGKNAPAEAEVAGMAAGCTPAKQEFAQRADAPRAAAS